MVGNRRDRLGNDQGEDAMAKNDKKSKKAEMKLLNRAAKKLIKQRRDRGQRGREHGS
jgi:hypothetical protein